MKAIYRGVRISPKKINLIASMVRDMHVEKADEILSSLPKKGARYLKQVLTSAVANAENNFSQVAADLYVTKILVTKGPSFKRHIPISRGRVHPIQKRTSHVTIEVGVKEMLSNKGEEKETKKELKAEKKVEVKKEENKAKSTKKTTKK